MGIRLWLDDLRPAPEGWVHVHWPDEAIAWLATGNVTYLSLDHDLGDDSRGTGYDVLQWLEKQVAMHGFVPPEHIFVHSANVAARLRMEAAIAAIRCLASKNSMDEA